MHTQRMRGEGGVGAGQGVGGWVREVEEGEEGRRGEEEEEEEAAAAPAANSWSRRAVACGLDGHQVDVYVRLLSSVRRCAVLAEG